VTDIIRVVVVQERRESTTRSWAVEARTEETVQLYVVLGESHHRSGYGCGGERDRSSRFLPKKLLLRRRRMTTTSSFMTTRCSAPTPGGHPRQTLHRRPCMRPGRRAARSTIRRASGGGGNKDVEDNDDDSSEVPSFQAPKLQHVVCVSFDSVVGLHSLPGVRLYPAIASPSSQPKDVFASSYWLRGPTGCHQLKVF
jgi:hypothetical protein